MIPMTSHLPSGVSWYLDSAGAPNPHDTGHADKENDGVAARKQHGGLSERTSSALSTLSIMQLACADRTISGVSDISPPDESSIQDLRTPAVELSFAAGERRAGAAEDGSFRRESQSETVGDWAATLGYCLDEGEDGRGTRYGACLQYGAASHVEQLTTDDEGHVDKRVLQDLAAQVKVQESYGLSDAAELLAARIAGSSIPAKLKALNIVVTITPEACAEFQDAARRCCLGPCEIAKAFSVQHPTYGAKPAALVRQSATAAQSILHAISPTITPAAAEHSGQGIDAFSVTEGPPTPSPRTVSFLS